MVRADRQDLILESAVLTKACLSETLFQKLKHHFQVPYFYGIINFHIVNMISGKSENIKAYHLSIFFVIQELQNFQVSNSYCLY